MMGELWRRLHYLMNRRRMDAELQSDMEFHREMAAGAGRRNFGNMLKLREDAREAWGWTWLDRLGQDLGYGMRMLARAPGFSVLAVLVLAIGIGVNVSAFSLFDMLALRPMPVRDPQSLVRLERRSPENYTSEMPYASLEFYAAHTKTLAAVIGVLGVPPMQFENDEQPVSASFATPNYFQELGTQAAYGRLLDSTRDSQASAPPVVVLSYGLWSRRFGGDPGVVGRVVRLNGKAATVVGITPYTMASLGGQTPEVWLPIAQQPYFVEGSKVLSDPSESSVRMWGRLARGVSAAMAEQELRGLTNELRKRQPKAIWKDEYLQSSAGGFAVVMQPGMYTVAAMVAVLTLLILAVSCANLGALMLARAVTREHEIGIRVAIGANRRRIFRQLCTENLLLAGLGATAGLGLGCLVVQVALRVLDAPKWLRAVPDWRVLLFTIGITVVAALFFGLAPALRIARQKQHKTTARQVLIGAQIAASMVLLVVAGLLVRATQHALFTDPGFGYQQLLSIDAGLDRHGYKAEQAHAYFNAMQQRLMALPGVESVSLVKLPPMGHTVSNFTMEVGGQQVIIYPNWVDPGFYRTMQIPLLVGRTFYPSEKHAVIVSEMFARRQWPGQNPVGQTYRNGDSNDTVVGVAGDAHVNALNEDDAMEVYWPAQEEDMPEMVLMARTRGGVDGVIPAIKTASENLDAKLFPEVRTMKALYRDKVMGVEKVAIVVSVMGGVAGLLAAIGMLGLTAFTVSQRTKEIAIRVALGASRGQVLASVLRQFRWPVLVGMVTGVIFAAATSGLLRRGLFGVSNLDVPGYAGAVAVLAGLIAVGAWLPARRALKLDVAKALHYE